ncbi:hypothetical protein ED28_16165 [[Pantoea] beijingensis]|uniref:Type III secretion protein n=1 Tax=[Pantoea] beijingensis TaxID=1324864 RepID=A0A443IA95_9GAMM|nr:MULTISPECIES: type III secretion protein [Erwiniaceae]RWR00983.1 hypothetical protein ED28_16165 [[Pantoea] beijingensis]
MRRHIDPETPPEPDLQAEELQRILKILLPIRKQRLSRSERVQRAEAAKLVACDRALIEGEQQLVGQRQEYRTVNTMVEEQYVGRTEALSTLRNVLNKEQTSHQMVLQQEIHLVQLDADRQQQQQKNENAQRDVALRQREVEKVEYLLQQHQGNNS